MISVFLFLYLFKNIRNIKIENRIRLTFKNIVIRSIVALIIILIVTGIAKFVNHKWAGLFSAFPITFFPFILIVHVTYGARYVHTIINNFPIGIIRLIIYSFSITITYPIYGIYTGTIISLLMATVYLVIYGLIKNRIGK